MAVFLHFSRQGGARADNAHLPAQDIDQLGQFVETCLAQNPSHSRDPRVVSHLEDRPVHFVFSLKAHPQRFGFGHHSAELVEGERPAIESAALLPEKDRSPA